MPHTEVVTQVWLLYHRTWPLPSVPVTTGGREGEMGGVKSLSGVCEQSTMPASPQDPRNGDKYEACLAQQASQSPVPKSKL